MRFWSSMGLCIALLTGVPALATAADPCMPAPRSPGSPIEAPHAVFEAYVVEVSAPRAASSEFGVLGTHRALVEVVRSYHGPYGPGQQVETLTIEGPNHCLVTVESGAHVVVRSESGGPFAIVANLSIGDSLPGGPIAVLANISDERRASQRPALKNAWLRGVIDGSLAVDLYTRARPDPRTQGEISSAGNFVQVSWGKAFGGNDARNKVIFERVDRSWVEILRYQAPTPTPVRNRGRRTKQRALWAHENGIGFISSHTALFQEMKQVPIFSQARDDASAG